MELNIRKAREEDYSRILELIKEFASSENKPDRVTNSVELMMDEKDVHNFIVAEANGQIIAFASYFLCYYSWTGKSLYLDDMYVVPEYRSKKVGSEMMEKIIEYAKSENCKKVRWQVSNWNKKAIDFYKDFGADIGDIEINCDLKL